jgi:hypothetical protein
MAKTTIADFERGGQTRTGTDKGPARPPRPELEDMDVVDEMDRGPVETFGKMMPLVREVEVEAVICGVLQRVRVKGITPDQTGDFIRGFDAGAKMRDDFPSKGFGRETKLASVFAVKGSCYNGNLSFDLTARGPDGPVSIRVNRDAGEFAKKLRDLGKIAVEEMDALEKALGEKKTYTIGPLDRADWFGAKYSPKGDDPGSGFLESIQAEGMAEITTKSG